MSPAPRPNLRDPVHVLAFGFGAGLSPLAPGTVGSVLGVLIFLSMTPLPLPIYIAVSGLLFLAGIWICGKASRDLDVHDHRGIVWDEIVGFLVAMTALPPDWPWILAAFLLFRFFDIVKPWPIGWLDRHVHGGLGIMLDDLAAGLGALLLLQLAFLLF
ncbi:MAG: phosphatidylglycerophosphatase A [Gammaproteobacteria bacterium]|nr:phosphatidylglycerophosphatase A [Gammaproteobacteria bacterium]MDH3414530.1 phosphatidylglycerophosphatase A [Gammaproteobacteria bacterium]